jgi:drug/metabolite transporter (DMT)-like permease
LAWGVLLAVLLGAALHAGWNALVKAGAHRFLDTVAVVAGAAIVAAVALPLLPPPLPGSWPYLAASALIHTGYFTLVALAYQGGDLSLVYPLMRGTAPALTAAAAAAALHEHPSAGAWAGVLLVSGGALLLTADSRRAGGVLAGTVALALGNALVIVLYTLIDGTGARLSGHAFSYTGWLLLLTAAPLVALALAIRPRAVARYLTRDWWRGLVGGACSLASYGLALWAMTQAPVAAVAALRETSIVFGAGIAVFALGERVSRLRCASVAVITAGAVAIKLL